MSLSRIFYCVAVLFILSACGFSPVYKVSNDNSALSNKLRSVKVEPIDSLIGQAYVTRLEDLLAPTGNRQEPQYKVLVTLEKVLVPLAIQQDRTITRYKIIVNAYYKLIDLSNGKVIDEAKLHREGEYDKVESDYATYVSENDTHKRIVKELAEDTRIRVTSVL